MLAIEDPVIHILCHQQHLSSLHTAVDHALCSCAFVEMRGYSLLTVPSSRLQRFGERCFISISSLMWNNLPDNIRKSFSRYISVYLCIIYYYSVYTHSNLWRWFLWPQIRVRSPILEYVVTVSFSQMSL